MSTSTAEPGELTEYALVGGVTALVLGGVALFGNIVHANIAAHGYALPASPLAFLAYGVVGLVGITLATGVVYFALVGLGYLVVRASALTGRLADRGGDA